MGEKNSAQKLAYFKGEGEKRVAVYPALNRQRPAAPSNPEEVVRLAAYNELQEKYKYPPELIDIEFPVQIREDENPRFADIVVFTDAAHKRPFIVVETKKPKRLDGEKQGHAPSQAQECPQKNAFGHARVGVSSKHRLLSRNFLFRERQQPKLREMIL